MTDTGDRTALRTGWLLIIPSVILGILAVELLGRLFLPPSATASVDMRLHRIVFLDGSGSIFRNQDDIFTYVPQSEMRNVTGFFTDDAFTVEYDYRFHTNNFGLVQDADIVPARASLLLLGDSFTEGQGAEPWFRSVAPSVETLGLQAINGGLMATGFAQWLKLDQSLTASGVHIGKRLVLFISDDYWRPVHNFQPGELQCLADLARCTVDEDYLYRLPPPAALASWIAKIRTARAPVINKIRRKMRAESFLPATYHVYEFFRNRLTNQGPKEDRAGSEQASRAAISEFITKFGPENVAFMHLPQKDEVGRDPDELGLAARRAIRQAGGKLFDGFKLCRLTAADYYANDEHPNGGGYAKIASCVTEAIKVM